MKIAGIDHGGIWSDFDGISGTANGLEDISKMPALVAVLLKRGYAESDLKKILGENHLRVVREVTGSSHSKKMTNESSANSTIWSTEGDYDR